MALEVTVANPAYWIGKPFELAQILRGAPERGQSTIGDPTGIPPDPANLLAIADPEYWSDKPNELAEAIAIATSSEGSLDAASPVRELERAGAGAIGGSHDRLTLTVEETADALGISRAFAYDAVRRNEIPHIRIGKRILIPRATLERMLDQSGSQPPPDGDRPS